jgi:hypothetical protein
MTVTQALMATTVPHLYYLASPCLAGLLETYLYTMGFT